MSLLTNRISCWLVVFLVVSGLFVAVGPLRANDDLTGAAAGQFLKLDPSARSAAMGSAMVARPADLASMPYNPAGLSGLANRQAQFTHNDLYTGIAYDHLAVAWPGASNRHAWGLSLTQVDYGDFQRTRISGSNPVTGLGQFDASDRSLALAYSRQFSTNLRVGVTGKYIRESIGNEAGQTPSLDVGLQYRSEVTGLVVGFAGRNLVGNLELQRAESPLPRLVETGLYYGTSIGDLHQVEVGSSLVYQDYGDAYVTLGAQYRYGGSMYVRSGYHGRQDAGRGLTFGGGLRIGRTTVDYAYIPFADLGSQQRLTFSFSF